MRTLISYFVMVAALCLAGGCASRWTLVKKSYSASGYRLQPPAKWMVLDIDGATVLSRHGPGLESIQVERRKADESFQGTSLTLSGRTLPHEIGELILLRKTALQDVLDVSLKAESPATVDGRKGVRVVFEYLHGGIPSTDAVYAFLDGGYYYELRYSAVTRHYFAQHLDAFERMVALFRVR
jgi:hypothetical protein